MKNFLSSLLNRFLGPEERRSASSRASAEDPEQEDAQAFESLAMTDELREALFPKSPQMISAIFDRPAPLDRPPAAAPSRDAATQGGASFSLVL